MILNLTDNAIKYSPSKSIVTLSVSHRDEGVRLTIEDNGPGIAQTSHQDVFERFVRLDKSAAEGCGLGLAIVREIANQHGASVNLKDVEKGGLCVEINFPTPNREGQ